MSVRYKFTNDLQYSTLPCDGFDVSLRDLKKAVVRAKKLGRITEFDLIVTNEQTSQVYNNDEDLIPKNSTLVVVRHPLPSGQKKVWEVEQLPSATINTSVSSNIAAAKGSSASSAISGGAFRKHDAEAESATEADKIDAMMDESTKMYATENWQNVRGRGRGSWGRGKIAGPPPSTYICVSCNQGGHWRGDCPIGGKSWGPDIKRTTGIPRSFLTPVPEGTPGAKMTPTGLLMGIEMEKNAYETKKSERPIWDIDESEVSLKSVNKGVEIPADLTCPICKDLLKDAIMMPSCACAMCDECARDSLIESETNTCPACKEPDNSPEDLIPWRQVRDKVNKFKNQSGYDKSNKSHDLLEKPKPVPLGVKPTLPDIYLPDPKDVNFDKMVSNGHISQNEEGANQDSPVYGMAGPSPPNYAVSPTQQLAPSGFGINNSLSSISANDKLENLSPSLEESKSLSAKGSKVPNDDTPPQSRSRSNSPHDVKSRSMSEERSKHNPGAISLSPKRRDSRRSSSGSGASPRSRAVPFVDTSLPPPIVHPSSTIIQPPGTIPQNGPVVSNATNALTSSTATQNLPPTIAGPAAIAPPGTLPPVIGPPPGTFPVRLPATVPTHLPLPQALPGHPDALNHPSLHLPPGVPPMSAAHHTGPLPPMSAYNHPPPHHIMHDATHDIRRGLPAGHGLPPNHMPRRDAYGIDKDGYIDDPLAAFERAMAMKDASKGRAPPRYDVRGPRRRYYSPEHANRYSSRSPPRYKERRSPYGRRSPTPPHYRERRSSRSPTQQRPKIHSQSPDGSGAPKGPKTPPHPHPLNDASKSPSQTTTKRHESPPPPPGTQSPESKLSPHRRGTPTPEKDGLQNITSTTQQSSNESKENDNSTEPTPKRERSSSPKDKIRGRSNTPSNAPRDGPRRSPGPYYRRTPPPSDHYRYSPSRRRSPVSGYDYPNHGQPDHFYRQERLAPPPPEEFYDRRSGEYGHSSREGYGHIREGDYGPRHRYPTDAPYYRNEYRERGRGYAYRGRGRGYNHYQQDNRRHYYNEEHPPHNYPRGNYHPGGSRRDQEAPRRSRSRNRSPMHHARSSKSPGKENNTKTHSTSRDLPTENNRKDRSHSHERTPSLTPEPEFREQQKHVDARETKDQEPDYNKTEYTKEHSKRDSSLDNEKALKDSANKRSARDDKSNLGIDEKDNKSRVVERKTDSSRMRSRSRSYERKQRERERENREIGIRDHRYESSRSRNKDHDYRSRDRREVEHSKDRPRSSGNKDRVERSPEDRQYSSRRRDRDMDRDNISSRQHRRNEEDLDKKKDRAETSMKDRDRYEKSQKEADHKEKKKKDKKKKKKRDESGNDTENHSETGNEKKKKKVKKDKKSKDDIIDASSKRSNPDLQDNSDTKNVQLCDENQIAFEHQESFENHISNLEHVLQSSDIPINDKAKQNNTLDSFSISKNDNAVPEASKWEKSDGDDTGRDEEGSSKEDKDLREILKAKSSLSNLMTGMKNLVGTKNGEKELEQMGDHEELIQDKIDGQEDSIDLHVDSEYEGMVEMSDKEGKKSKYQDEKNSDSSSEEKISKKKRKKEKKEKKHKKDEKKGRKKSKKMLKELLGKDTLEELLSKLEEGQNPEDVIARAVQSKNERNVSRSPSPRPQRVRERKEHDSKRYSHDESRNQNKENSSRRAVVSDGKSLKMTIDRDSPREERARRGKRDTDRRGSHDRSEKNHSRRRSVSRSPSPKRQLRADDTISSKGDESEKTNSRLMEMSMQSSLERPKKLSIKDRLGPIRGPGTEDRSTLGFTKSKRRISEDSLEVESGSLRRKEINSSNYGKEDKISTSRKSPTTKEKWGSNGDDNSRKRRDKAFTNSEYASPPSKKSRDSSESKEIIKREHDRSVSPSGRVSLRKSSKQTKHSEKLDEDLDDEEKSTISGAIKSKRTSSRLERKK